MSERFDLHAHRLNRGMTQRDLAAECGVSLTVIQRLENGGQATPANAKRVADFFGVRVTDLMPLDREAA